MASPEQMDRLWLLLRLATHFGICGLRAAIPVDYAIGEIRGLQSAYDIFVEPVPSVDEYEIVSILDVCCFFDWAAGLP